MKLEVTRGWLGPDAAAGHRVHITEKLKHPQRREKGPEGRTKRKTGGTGTEGDKQAQGEGRREGTFLGTDLIIALK